MVRSTVRRREAELVAELARHAYPTAEASSLQGSWASSMLPCRSCRQRRPVGYFRSGPCAGEDLWVCDTQEGER